ncbi:MAG: LPS export ABC transporter permease LptG [Thermodesulfobacteriota bacterium]|nr:LPS export ABC transporter permease LptG [Thermodesulfobacteriota bacterium]
MLIISRNITGQFLKIFLLCLFASFVIYITIDLFENLDIFIKYHPEFILIFKYFLNKTPLIINQVTPIGILLSTLICVGLMVRNREITALKACGVYIHRFFIPIFICVSFIGLGAFFIQESLIPLTKRNLKNIMNVEIKKKKSTSFFRRDDIWIKDKNRIYNIEFFDSKNNNLSGITILNFDTEFILQSRLDSSFAEWTENGWKCKDVIIRTFSSGILQKVESFNEMYLPFKETPNSLKAASNEPEDMNIMKLKRFIEVNSKKGYGVNEYKVVLYAKTAFPFVNLILSIFGISLALFSERKGEVVWGIGVSIFISFIYWLFMSYSQSFGKAGIFPPFIAAWLPNFVFSAFAIYLFLKIKI